MSQYRQKIKKCLQTITNSIKQIPLDKQPIIKSRVSKVLQKYTNMKQQTDVSLQQFHKDLQFNLNFLKLSYPNINFQYQELQQPGKQNKIQNKQQQQQKDPIKEGEFEIDNSLKLKKQMVDISGVRQQVDFTNWSQGNVDPQNLKRHKQLLSRQHFGGDFWKGKQMPALQAGRMLQAFLQNPTMEPPTVTDKDLQKKPQTFAFDPAQRFQKVKR